MLPQGTEPLVLADGTKVNPIDGAVIQDDYLVEVPNTEDMKREIVAARKRISDLPVPPKQMNTISVILSYTLFGIDDESISRVLSLTTKQIETIKSSDVYKELLVTFIKNIIKSDLSDVRGMFVDKSKTAADKMFNLLDSESESTVFSAAKDVLDRAGQRPIDIVEHRHKVEGGLTIQYIEKSDDIPIIDVTPEGEM